VLPADFVSTEDGTGIVHTTPPLRRNQGLPATAITRGVWAEIGPAHSWHKAGAPQ